jgi:hypothetical protein
LTGRLASEPVSAARRLPGRALAAAGIAAAVAAGAALGWAARDVGPARWAGHGSGPVIVIGVLAAVLAAANGYSKAYSP